MQLNISQSGSDAIVGILTPCLDASVARQFKTEMSAVINNGAKHIVLDMAALGMVDSNGLGTLVSILKLLNGQGTIVIRAATPAVLRVFKLTHMDHVFTIEAPATAS
jgi:anti-sigma B factor antagonist